MQDQETGLMHQVGGLDHNVTPVRESIARQQGKETMLFKNEVLNIKGGNFIVKSIGKRCVMLEGLPGTQAKAMREEREELLDTVDGIMSERQQMVNSLILVLRQEGPKVIELDLYRTIGKEEGVSIEVNAKAGKVKLSHNPGNPDLEKKV